jgi:hypothetical protein
MAKAFDRKTECMFGGASRFWFAFVAVTFFIWLSPLFMEQEALKLRTVLVGAIPFLIGICLRLTYHGIQIDPEQNRIREYTAVLGFKTGTWAALSNLRKISLTSKSVSSWNTSNGISPTFRNTRTLYTTALYAASATPAYSIQTENKKAARKDTKTLSELLHLQVESSI